MTVPPIGRAAKPTAYVLNASSVPTNGSKVGKNSLLNTSAAAVLYRKKSYHSIDVPIRLASATSRIEWPPGVTVVMGSEIVSPVDCRSAGTRWVRRTARARDTGGAIRTGGDCR